MFKGQENFKISDDTNKVHLFIAKIIYMHKKCNSSHIMYRAFEYMIILKQGSCVCETKMPLMETRS